MPLQLKASADATFKIRSAGSILVLAAQGDRVALLPEIPGSKSYLVHAFVILFIVYAECLFVLQWKYNPSNESVQNVETGLYISIDGKV